MYYGVFQLSDISSPGDRGRWVHAVVCVAATFVRRQPAVAPRAGTRAILPYVAIGTLADALRCGPQAVCWPEYRTST